MSAKDGCRASCGDGVFERAPDTLSLAAPWDGNNQLGHLEHRWNRQRESPLRNIFEPLEPTFGQLLLPACRIERNYFHRVRIVEVCLGRIVKRQVSVFADSQQTELRISLTQLLNIVS